LWLSNFLISPNERAQWYDGDNSTFEDMGKMEEYPRPFFRLAMLQGHGIAGALMVMEQTCAVVSPTKR
tara:strand:+ start:300 stop:503 length:204 start_codon:yes stop_codon:yes gene_type:complete